MRPSLTRRFPQDWRVTATLHKSPGRDRNGDPTPAQDIAVEDCLWGPSASADGREFTDAATSRGVLLAPVGTDASSTSAVTVPGHGTYDVDGEPALWPMGVAITLTRGGA